MLLGARRLLARPPCRPACRVPALRLASSRTRSSHGLDQERRFGLDGKPLGRSDFVRKYGEAEWLAAADRPYVEMRVAPDGVAYTWQEFRDYFSSGGSSDRDGVAYEHWDAARHYTHKLTKEITWQPSIDEVLELHAKYEQGMDDIHIATCWVTVSKLASKNSRERAWLRRNEAELQPLREHTLAMMRSFQARGLANVTHAVAKAGLTRGADWCDLLDALAGTAMPRLSEFIPQDLANTAWAYATAKHSSPDLFAAMEAEVKQRGGIEAMSPEKARTQLSHAFDWARI